MMNLGPRRHRCSWNPEVIQDRALVASTVCTRLFWWKELKYPLGCFGYHRVGLEVDSVVCTPYTNGRLYGIHLSIRKLV